MFWNNIIVCTFKVSNAMSLENQEFAVNKNGLLSAFVPSKFFNNAQNTFLSTTEDSWRIMHRVLWSIGKFFLSAGESFNSAWDVALSSVLSLLKTGGVAYNAVVSRIGHVPVLGFGASGVNEVIKTSLDVVESNAKHDMAARRKAFVMLNHKINESGTRLSGQSDRPLNHASTVLFPQNWPADFSFP